MFKENFRAKMNQLNMTAKDIANAMEKNGYSFGAKEPHRIVQSWIAKRSYLPSVISGYAIARSLKTTVEELVDGETGLEYVRKVIRNDPRAIQVPDRIYSIVENLLFLNENELIGIRANVEALAETKKERGTGTDGLPG